MRRRSLSFERSFVNSFIDFSKPLAAVINGPAVGISVTLLGLFDLVLATDKVKEDQKMYLIELISYD